MEIRRLASKTLRRPTSYRGWLWLILLTAVFLRLYHITDVPPGLTHDEADHGLSAWGVVNGERPIYFTIGYGREPLYDYVTAGLMALLGPTYLAGRLTAVFASLLLIVVMFAWVRLAFNPLTALLTAAGLALSFWPQMTGRQMLRSSLLPTLFTLAVYFFWRGTQSNNNSTSPPDKTKLLNYPIVNYLLCGLFLGLTFYTYLPARVLWLMLPALLLFWLGTNRPLFHNTWHGTLLTLGVAAVIGLPLFYYLATHPTLEVRVQELSTPLTAAFQGNFKPLWHNSRDSLRLLTLEGDSAWRYTIPGRPFLGPMLSFFFYLGLLIALWQMVRQRHAGAFLALVWLGLGLSPVLVTGPELATTQAIGAQPVLYLFPAIVLGKVADWQIGRSGDPTSHQTFRHLLLGVYALLFVATAVFTYRDYFLVWANAPAVRVQYEATMMAAMRYLNENDVANTAVSTITPGPFHTPALAQMTLHNSTTDIRWFDARAALLWPAEPHSRLLIPGFTPVAPALKVYLADTAVLQQTLPLRLSDADRPLDIYEITDPDALLTHFTLLEPVSVGDNMVELLGYDLPTATVQPGETVRLVTLWRVQRPLPDAVLFTHLLAADGQSIAQADRLDAPGYAWQAGDHFVQLHELVVPPETAVGTYTLDIGVYISTTGQRLPLSRADKSLGDHLQLTNLTITGE